MTKIHLHLLFAILGFLTVQAQAGERFIVSTTGVDFARVGQSIQQAHLGVQVVHALENLDLYVIETQTHAGVGLLAALPGVTRVTKDMIAPLPKFNPSSLTCEATTETDVNPWGIQAVKAPAAWKLSRGEGATVIVIDTGIDRDHPALKANFVEGKNFTQLNGTPAYEYFDTYGHGTHVAGTIAGDGTYRNLYGVAPKAKILSARVCHNDGCPYSDIYAGVNWGITMHADIMNLSLGGGDDFTGAQVYLKAKQAGITIIAAAGNDGEAEVSYPAGYDSVMAIGAVDSALAKASFSNYGKGLDVVAPGVNVLSSIPQGTGSFTTINFSQNNVVLKPEATLMEGSQPSKATLEGQLVYANLGKPEDFAKVDVKGKIALIKRGEIPFVQKAQAALDAGAIGAVIFNNVAGALAGTLNSTMDFAVFALDMDTGTKLTTSVWTASAAIESKSNFAVFNGTSMASPHVAGIAALVKSANHNLTPDQIYNIIKTSATDLKNVNDFGAGMVNAELAVKKAN